MGSQERVIWRVSSRPDFLLTALSARNHIPEQFSDPPRARGGNCCRLCPRFYRAPHGSRAKEPGPKITT
jgi:hypothetical protein